MFKSVDDKLAELGFVNVFEDTHSVDYERIENRKYIQCIHLIHKATGEYLILTYKEDVYSGERDLMMGLTYQEMNLAIKKLKQMKRKYKW